MVERHGATDRRRRGGTRIARRRTLPDRVPSHRRAAAHARTGGPVAKRLCACGAEDPASESAKAQQLLTDKFHVGDVQLVIVVSAPGGANGSAASTVGTGLVDDLKASPHVTSVTSLWTASPPERAALASSDGRSGLIVAGIAGK